MPIDISPGDRVRLKKMHPCGGYDWEIVRTGADIGLKCIKCRHYIILKRSLFERKFRCYLPRKINE